ncbi:hypothetical protein BGX28_008176 [Mortierella sp. GBA30]|nr:hypothetical protein BGX28_008176 [Mortierella sp. GBA30]
MEYEYQYQHGSFAATASTSAPETSSRRKSSYLTKSPPPVPSYPSQHLYQQSYRDQCYEDRFPQQHQRNAQPPPDQYYHEGPTYMELDGGSFSSGQAPQPSRQKPPPLRKAPNRELDQFSTPPIMTAPVYGTTKVVSSQFSPPPYYTTAQMSSQEIYSFGNADKGANGGDMSLVHQEPQQQPLQQHQHHYYGTSDIHRGTQPVSQYYQDLPATPLLTVTPRSKRPKSLAAHEFTIGGEQVYPRKCPLIVSVTEACLSNNTPG